MIGTARELGLEVFSTFGHLIGDLLSSDILAKPLTCDYGNEESLCTWAFGNQVPKSCKSEPRALAEAVTRGGLRMRRAHFGYGVAVFFSLRKQMRVLRVLLEPPNGVRA